MDPPCSTPLRSVPSLSNDTISSHVNFSISAVNSYIHLATSSADTICLRRETKSRKAPPPPWTVTSCTIRSGAESAPLGPRPARSQAALCRSHLPTTSGRRGPRRRRPPGPGAVRRSRTGPFLWAGRARGQPVGPRVAARQTDGRRGRRG